MSRSTASGLLYPGARIRAVDPARGKPPPPPRPRLLDRVRDAIRSRHYNRRTEKAYVQDVLGVDLRWLDDVVRAKRPQYLPVVLTREETWAVLQQLTANVLESLESDLSAPPMRRIATRSAAARRGS